MDTRITISIDRLPSFVPDVDEICDLAFCGARDMEGTMFLVENCKFYRDCAETVYICDSATGRLLKRLQEEDLLFMFIEQ